MEDKNIRTVYNINFNLYSKTKKSKSMDRKIGILKKNTEKKQNKNKAKNIKELK